MEEDRLLKKKRQFVKVGNVKKLAQVLRELGDYYFAELRYEDALQQYKEQLEACQCANDKLNSAVAHRMIGEVQTLLGNFENALTHLQLYLEGARDLRDLCEEQRAYVTLGRTYFVYSESFQSEETEENVKMLANAKTALMQSICICDKLERTKIDLKELMTMRARCMLNLGLVLEAQKELKQAITLIKNAADLCQKHKLHEDRYRTLISLAGIHDRQGHYQLALKHLSSASDVNDINLRNDVQISKAELYFKLGEWIEARKILVRLYQQKGLSEDTREVIERLLRIAVTICRTEDALLIETNPIAKQRLCENLGDAAVAAKAYEKAIEFYQEMLHFAEEIGSDRIAAALTSLSQTLRDAGKYDEAIIYAQKELKLMKDPRESCRSSLWLAELYIKAKCPQQKIIEAFESAVTFAQTSRDEELEASTLKKLLAYLERTNPEEAGNVRKRLEILPLMESEDEESVPLDIGGDIQLEDLSDLEEEREKRAERSSRRAKRAKKCILKKNEKGETQLHVACIAGNISQVEKLLEEGHPTNVRDNAGWTPLHEAANYGYVEIARMLIRAGANVNDPGGPDCQGVTPLHDAATCGHAPIITLLLDSRADANLLTDSGENVLDCLEAWRSRAGNLSVEDSKDYETIKTKLLNLVTVRGKKKKVKSWLIDDSEEEADEIEEVEGGERDRNSAGEDYKRIMESLKRTDRNMDKPKKLEKITAPLLDSEEMLVGEWLDDDVGITKKRNNLGDKLHPQEKKNHSAKRLTSPVKRRSFEVIEVKKLTKRKSSLEGDNLMKKQRIDDEVEPCLISDDSSRGSWGSISNDEFNAFEPFSKKRKKQRQMNLLKSGYVIKDSRTPSPQPAENLPEKQILKNFIPVEVVDVIVDVEKERFKYILNFPQDLRTVAELASDVEIKFEKETGCKIKLNLKTIDGGVLSLDTTVDLLRRERNKIQLIGEILNDLPPILDRFRNLCKMGDIAVNEATVKALKTCENTGTFRLPVETTDEEMVPLLKAIQYQKDLQILQLSGGSFYGVFDILIQCLAKLPSMYELHLQCCDIDLHFLSKIERLPSQIRVLDLSYNPIGPNCHQKLNDLLAPLKRLQTLNLRYCELDGLRFTFTNNSLISLDVSWNPLSSEGATDFLQRQLLNLNLSNTRRLHQRRSVVDELLGNSSLSLISLESLELTSCQISDAEVAQILSLAPNISRIVLSGNPDVTAVTVSRILGRRPTMSYVDVGGCKEIMAGPDSNLIIESPQMCTLMANIAYDVVEAWQILWEGKCSLKHLPGNLIVFRPI